MKFPIININPKKIDVAIKQARVLYRAKTLINAWKRAAPKDIVLEFAVEMAVRTMAEKIINRLEKQ